MCILLAGSRRASGGSLDSGMVCITMSTLSFVSYEILHVIYILILTSVKLANQLFCVGHKIYTKNKCHGKELLVQVTSAEHFHCFSQPLFSDLTQYCH